MRGHHHSGTAENVIKNVVRIARTTMIHAALRWPDESERRLCPMAMSHAVHLQNYTPHISSGLSTEEFWTRSNSSHSALQNAHQWGCPAYVLEPILQYGTIFLSGCQGIGELNIWDPPLYMPVQWAWSGTYRLEISALSFIWCLVTILILCIQDRIKNLQFGHNLSPLSISRVHMMMRTMSLTLLISGWIHQLWKSEGIRKPIGTPRYQSRRKIGLMIQESNILDIY